MTTERSHRVSYTRERVRGSEAAVSQLTEQYAGYPSNVAPYSKGIVGAPCTSEVMNDVVTPSFAKISAEGDVVFSPMNQAYYSTSGSTSKYEVTIVPPYTPVAYLGGVYTGVGNYLKFVLLQHKRANVAIRISERGANHLGAIFRLTASQRDRVANEAALRAMTIPSDASLIVALAESRQTLMMLPDLCRSFSRMLANINIRHARWLAGRQKAPWGMAARNLRDEATFLTDLWLQIRFGLRPLISDIAGVQKALGRARKSMVVRETSRGSSHLSIDGTSSAVLSMGVLNFAITEYSSESVSTRAMALWEAKADVLDDLGVSISNLPLAVIDLTAFSFVLNWMVTLNEYVSAISASLQPGWTRKGGCVVTRHASVTTYTLTDTSIPSSFPGFGLTTKPQGMLMITERKVARVPGLPTPVLGLRPGPLAWASDFRLADAVALVAQQVRGNGVQRLLGLASSPHRFK